jgi:hypothetical protein
MKKYAIATIGFGGCTAYAGTTRCSGFPRAQAFEYADLVVDLTTAPYERLAHLSVCGPMIDPRLPPGTLNAIGKGIVRFDPMPDPSRPAHLAFLGNAHAFDDVDIETYVKLAERVGATIHDRRLSTIEHAS